ncbi:hypothetical protein V6N13_064968 [Hibiscus sabdariffa]
MIEHSRWMRDMMVNVFSEPAGVHVEEGAAIESLSRWEYRLAKLGLVRNMDEEFYNTPTEDIMSLLVAGGYS